MAFSSSLTLQDYTTHQTAEQQHILIKELGSGQSATVFLSVPRSIADKLLTGYTWTDKDTTTLARLRANLQAIKVRTDNDRPANANVIDHEAKILRILGKYPHPNVVRLIESDSSPLEKAWYTMQLCHGTLDDVLIAWVKSKTKPSISFAWHMAHQLAAALLYLQFSNRPYRRQVSSEMWPILVHGDMQTGNVLFRFLDHEQDGSYPDLMVSDFGYGSYLARDTATPDDRWAALQRQYFDIKHLLSLLSYFENRTTDKEFVQAVGGLSGVKPPSKNAVWNDSAYQRLSWFASLAEKRCKELYQPLPVDFETLIHKQLVGDGELKLAFPAHG